MKLAVIGGGSSYTPELIDGLFSRLDRIPVTEVWLMDPNLDRLEITAGLAERMSQKHGIPFTVHATDDLRAAVQDASYVVTQLRVGGIQARIQDEKLGLKYGIIGQETTGVGGFACALRTIPRILDIAHTMQEVAPKGFLINFTNPSGIVTEALIKHGGVRCVGLCNVPIGIIMDIAKFMQCSPQDVQLDYVGLNHLSWVQDVRIAGKSVFDDVLNQFLEHADEEWEHEPTREAMVLAMRTLHMICNGYLQYFYATEEAFARLSSREKTRGEEIIEIERSLFEKYAQKDLTSKPEELSKRGGAHYSTAAFMVIDAIENNTQDRQIVCCRNSGAVPTFDADVSLEVPALIDRMGATAISQPAPPPAIRGLMQQMKAYETLTVEAAVRGDRKAALEALLLHPLLPGIRKAKDIFDELLAINRPHLQGTFF
ncbi:MAG TPA: 6-phospho-beta-glucosidase [Candidatus Hydrogenedentes bacterium]|nr:6-phospho-beta-glucosidase [Candidatus Hydrogenedentota bacterium]HOL77776.1 6-phospho-beta-glucosidase [Candidatus Hydrogenedentota bacterium]HPO86410.1 6-phospho-beta-glucosidase [Candidatus Hydrogenedentota bacterium]